MEKLLFFAVGFLFPLLAAAQVSIQEYPLPRGLGAHDVWADPAPGGPVYFSAQQSGELGILDPQTGKVKSVPLGPGSSPHGVIVASDGAPWLTDGGQNATVRVGPYGIQTTPDGTVYYASLAGSYIARIDAASGEAAVIQPPTKGQGARRVWPATPRESMRCTSTRPTRCGLRSGRSR